MSKKKHYQTDIIKELDDSLKMEWIDLWERSENATLFNSYEWFLTCIKAKKITNYELHVCYREGKLVALLPLQKYRVFGITVYGSICKEFLADTPFLIESYDKTLFSVFFQSILKKKNIYLQKVDSIASEKLHSLYPNQLFSLSSVNPTLVLASENPFENASSSTMHKLRGIIKKNSGQLRFVVNEKNLEKPLQSMFNLQKNSSKKARSMDIFENKETKEYYRILTKYCEKYIRINLLYFEKEIIAYEYGFLYKDIYLGAQISYHKDYKKLAPGRLIIYYLIDSLRNTGVSILDQGGGISSYKSSFANGYRTLYNMYYSENTLTLGWWKLINIIRRKKQEFFPKKNTNDHEFLFKTL